MSVKCDKGAIMWLEMVAKYDGKEGIFEAQQVPELHMTNNTIMTINMSMNWIMCESWKPLLSVGVF